MVYLIFVSDYDIEYKTKENKIKNWFIKFQAENKKNHDVYNFYVTVSLHLTDFDLADLQATHFVQQF